MLKKHIAMFIFFLGKVVIHPHIPGSYEYDVPMLNLSHNQLIALLVLLQITGL